jgi:hypothetical protein
MNLHDQFDDLAGDMTGTDLADLRHRVDRTSRRLRTRRTLATSAAAVAVVAALTGGATLLQLQGDDQPPVLPGTSARPSQSPSQPQPPSTPASGPTSSTPSTVDAVPGALSFLTLKAGKPIELRRYVDGTLQTVNFGTATSKDMYATPSPDGTRLAINTSTNHDTIAPGDLVVVSAGGARRTVARDVNWSGGSTVIWTPDGTTLIADGVRYDAATGARTPFPDEPQYPAYSPSGTMMAYISPTQYDSIKIVKVDGTAPRTVSVAGLDECVHTSGCPTSVQSVSDDGRYLALGNVNSDPQHVYTTVLVYDTVAKQRLPLGTFQHVWFRPDGAVVVTATQVKVLDKAWKVVHTYPLPAHDASAEVFYRS